MLENIPKFSFLSLFWQAYEIWEHSPFVHCWLTLVTFSSINQRLKITCKMKIWIYHFLEKAFYWCIILIIDFRNKTEFQFLIFFLQNIVSPIWSVRRDFCLQKVGVYSPLQKNSPRNFTVRRFGYSNHLPKRIMKQMIHHWKALI